MTSARLLCLIVLVIVVGAKSSAAQKPIDPCESVRIKLAGSEPANLTLGEIAKNPTCYADRFIRLIGIYRVAFENSDLYDPELERARAWVEFDPYYGAIKRCSNRNLKVLDRKDGGTFGPIALGILRTRGRYGHLNGWDYQFEPICIDKAELLSKSGSVLDAHDKPTKDRIAKWYKNEIRKLY